MTHRTLRQIWPTSGFPWPLTLSEHVTIMFRATRPAHSCASSLATLCASQCRSSYLRDVDRRSPICRRIVRWLSIALGLRRASRISAVTREQGSIVPDRMGSVRGLTRRSFHRIAFTDWGSLAAPSLLIGAAKVSAQPALIASGTRFRSACLWRGGDLRVTVAAKFMEWPAPPSCILRRDLVRREENSIP